MKCEYCGAPSKVTQQRATQGGAVVRVRKCQNDHTFHTIEHTYTPHGKTRDNTVLEGKHHGHLSTDSNA